MSAAKCGASRSPGQKRAVICVPCSLPSPDGLRGWSPPVGRKGQRQAWLVLRLKERSSAGPKDPKTSAVGAVAATSRGTPIEQYRGVAQLVGRYVRDVEVVGSSPTTLTTTFLNSTEVGLQAWVSPAFFNTYWICLAYGILLYISAREVHA